MKTIILFIALFFFNICLKGQMLVNDAQANYTHTLKYVGDKEAQLKVRLQNIEMIEKTAKMLKYAKKTKENIEEVWMLQKKIREELKVCAEGIKRLNFNSAIYLGSELVGESFNPADYIPNTPLSKSLKTSLNYDYNSKVAEESKHVINEWFTSSPTKRSDLFNYTNELIECVQGMGSYSAKNDIARAMEQIEITKEIDVTIDSLFKIANNSHTLELSDMDRIELNLKMVNLKQLSIDKANAARTVLVKLNNQINKVKLREYKLVLNMMKLDDFIKKEQEKVKHKTNKVLWLAKYDK